ncbi:lysozyme inhibitor LprI family protein [Marilutibacter chinensis]|nr:lysozyme inhibitor LprI family protein [Lysobacter chinensis]
MRLAFILVLAALSGAVAAQPACNPDGTQQEMNACAFDEYAAADAELNRVYRAVLASRAGDAVFAERLRAAQRLWIRLRDADLDAEFPIAEGEDPRIEYGSIYPLERAAAMTRMTRERTRYLREQWLDDARR